MRNTDEIAAEAINSYVVKNKTYNTSLIRLYK